jgi:hypothetical protein
MKKYFLTVIIVLTALGFVNTYSEEINRKAVLDSLTSINPDIKQYFPRWKVCETDLMYQIYQSFVTLGYDKSKLSMQNIEILAAPREYTSDPYEILNITCGECGMNTVEIESNLGDILVGFLAGAYTYSGPSRGERRDDGKRDYCYNDVPIDIPFSPPQVSAIVSYLEPTDVNHAITLSIFEQSVKIGTSGFWLSSQIGVDQIGYPFWNAGESKIVLKRPLYPNYDNSTKVGIPYLINAYLGGAYRITSGINTNGTMLSWVKSRLLNTGTGGKLLGGIDFSFPFHPVAGVSFNVEMPLKTLSTEAIDIGDYGYYGVPVERQGQVDFSPTDPMMRNGIRIDMIAPILRASGQFTLFYNWWLNPQNPENYFRFDFGLSYAEVKEMAYYRIDSLAISYLSNEYIDGLKTFKNNEFGDWMYAKVEYRNQAAFPFGMSLQYSNQILLGRVYIPLFGRWLYIEGKYATPVRPLRPYETQHFFMISPVLRLTI